MCNGEVIPIKAFAVPRICEKLGSQVVQKAINLHPSLEKFKLADNGEKQDVCIELLFGADVYWKLVTGEIRKDDESGLIAINSKFGWLLNDRVPEYNASNNLISADLTTMRIEAENEVRKGSRINEVI